MNNTDLQNKLLEVARLCNEIHFSNKGIVFYEYSGHVDKLSVSIRRINDYSLYHPKWNNVFEWVYVGGDHGYQEYGIDCLIGALKEFSELKIIETDEYQDELLTVMG